MRGGVDHPVGDLDQRQPRECLLRHVEAERLMEDWCARGLSLRSFQRPGSIDLRESGLGRSDFALRLRRPSLGAQLAHHGNHRVVGHCWWCGWRCCDRNRINKETPQSFMVRLCLTSLSRPNRDFGQGPDEGRMYLRQRRPQQLLSVVSKTVQRRPQIHRARHERSLLGGGHVGQPTRFGAAGQAVAISSPSAMHPPNQIQQIGEPVVTRRRLGPNPVRKMVGRIGHLFRDATKHMHSHSHTRHHQRNPGDEGQLNSFSATTGGGLVLSSRKSTSVRRGPSPVRSVKE